MFKALIYKGKKVFSEELKPSDSITPVLNKLKQKEGLGTAVLLLEGKERRFLLFILEDVWYALYRLSEHRLTPLSFSAFFSESERMTGCVSLYRVTPVLFKSLLMIAQREPSLVLTNEVLDLERLLSHLAKNKKEAVVVLKKKNQANIFYFIEGILRDAYLEETFKVSEEPGSEAKRLLKIFSKAGLTRLELFDEADVQPARDCETAMHEIYAGGAFPPSANGGPPGLDPVLDPNDETPLPRNFISQDNPTDLTGGTKRPDLWVEVLTGSRTGFLIRVSKEPVTLGRGNVDIQLNDPQVSRVHAKLEWTPSGAVIRDQNSTNGLFVNGSKVKKKTLRLNDEIRLGDIRLKTVSAS